MKYAIIVFSVLLLVGPAFAQYDVFNPFAPPPKEPSLPPSVPIESSPFDGFSGSDERPGTPGKDASTAAIGSLILPGLGQVYAGDHRRGLGFLGMELVELGLSWVFLLASYPEDGGSNLDPMPQMVSFVFLVSFIITHSYNVYDAHRTVSTMNMARELTLRPVQNEDRIALAFCSRF